MSDAYNPHECLAAWLKRKGKTAVWLASVLRTAQPSVSRWINEKGRPDPHQRKALEVLTGIPDDAWFTLDERAIIAGAAREAREMAAAEAPRPTAGV